MSPSCRTKKNRTYAVLSTRIPSAAAGCRRFLPTTRLKSNICGGDDGVCNDGHKLWQSQCEAAAKISSSGDLGRSDNSHAKQLSLHLAQAACKTATHTCRHTHIHAHAHTQTNHFNSLNIRIMTGGRCGANQEEIFHTVVL